MCTYGLNLWRIKRIYATAESLQLHTHRWHYKNPACTLSQWSTVAQAALVFLFRRNVVLHVFTNGSWINLEPLLVLFLLTRQIYSRTVGHLSRFSLRLVSTSVWKKYQDEKWAVLAKTWSNILYYFFVHHRVYLSWHAMRLDYEWHGRLFLILSSVYSIVGQYWGIRRVFLLITGKLYNLLNKFSAALNSNNLANWSFGIILLCLVSYNF